MSKFKEMKETHMKGNISIETIPDELFLQGDLGIQIGVDGRVWICINGIAFLRFNPWPKKYLKDKNE